MSAKYKSIPLSDTIRERFFAKVRIRADGCHEWAGHRDLDKGYGRFYIGRDATTPHSPKAHIVAWRIYHGDWPTQHLLHTCDNPWCVNPEHLREGSQYDNMCDMHQKDRGSRRRYFTQEDIEDIERMRLWGMSYGVIADHYGVDSHVIITILTRSVLRLTAQPPLRKPNIPELRSQVWAGTAKLQTKPGPHKKHKSPEPLLRKRGRPKKDHYVWPVQEIYQE